VERRAFHLLDRVLQTTPG